MSPPPLFCYLFFYFSLFYAFILLSFCYFCSFSSFRAGVSSASRVLSYFVGCQPAHPSSEAVKPDCKPRLLTSAALRVPAAVWKPARACLDRAGRARHAARNMTVAARPSGLVVFGRRGWRWRRDGCQRRQLIAGGLMMGAGASLPRRRPALHVGAVKQGAEGLLSIWLCD